MEVLSPRPQPWDWKSEYGASYLCKNVTSIMFVFIVYIGLICLIIYSMGGHFEHGNCNKIKLRLIEIINELELHAASAA